MGNVLCKNRKNQIHANKETSDSFIGRCTQICPHSFGKKKHFWDKQILETSPPCQQQPKASGESGWQTVSLTVPDGPGQHPIPPPRKKRLSSQHQHSNEEKELENSDTDDLKSPEMDSKIIVNQNRPEVIEDTKISITETLNDVENQNHLTSEINDENKLDKKEKIEVNNLEMSATKENQESIEDTIEELSEINDKKVVSQITRNISKVGNKKSDKFFGENLSESLSSEPIDATQTTAIVDELINKSKSNKDSEPNPETTNEQCHKAVENSNIPDKTRDITANSEQMKNSIDVTKKDFSVDNINLNTKTEIQTKQNDNITNKSLIPTDETDQENSHEISRIESVEESEEMLHQINKEKGNLLFSIANQVPNKNATTSTEQNEINYDDMKPVEEAVIVPIRRKTHPHICDDETHLHDILHHHQHNHNDNNNTTDVIPPKKPQRDFAKYRKSLEIVNPDEIISIDDTLKTSIHSENVEKISVDDTKGPLIDNSVISEENKILSLEKTLQTKLPNFNKEHVSQKIITTVITQSNPSENEKLHHEEDIQKKQNTLSNNQAPQMIKVEKIANGVIHHGIDKGKEESTPNISYSTVEEPLPTIVRTTSDLDNKNTEKNVIQISTTRVITEELQSPGILNKILEKVSVSPSAITLTTGEKRRHSKDNDPDSDSDMLESSTKKERLIVKDNENNTEDREVTKIITTTIKTSSVINTPTKTDIQQENFENNNVNLKNDEENSNFIRNKTDHSPLLKFLEQERTNYVK